jgi:Uma2 family endonuclease
MGPVRPEDGRSVRLMPPSAPPRLGARPLPDPLGAARAFWWSDAGTWTLCYQEAQLVIAMAQPPYQPLTFKSFEDFLDWERHQEAKHELIDGVPRAMAGGSEGHNIIQGNLFASALSKLRGSPCRPFPSDMAVKTGTAKGRYPDVTIDCGPRNPGNRSAPNPAVLFEVLSPETQKEDRTIKLAEYNAVPSVAHYVLVEQSEPLVHVYSRGASGDFTIGPQEIRGLDGTFELPAAGISMTLAEIYEGVAFDAEVDPEALPPTRSPWRH